MHAVDELGVVLRQPVGRALKNWLAETISANRKKKQTILQKQGRSWIQANDPRYFLLAKVFSGEAGDVRAQAEPDDVKVGDRQLAGAVVEAQKFRQNSSHQLDVLHCLGVPGEGGQLAPVHYDYVVVFGAA